MKSYFSRFLHHILSHSDVNQQSAPMLSHSGLGDASSPSLSHSDVNQQSAPMLSHSGLGDASSPSLSHSDLIGVSRSNQVANFSNLDCRIKSDNDTLAAGASTYRGRSMVEMLGVLAIIGVLSVGAIAGYSKAMFKYKLNKQAESFNMLLNTAIQLQPDFDRTVKAGGYFRADFFHKANLIPDGMTYKNNHIYDVFMGSYEIMYYSSKLSDGHPYTEYLIQYDVARSGNSATSRSIEICRNMLTVAKENAGDLPFIQMRSGKDNTSGDFDESRIYGDKECPKNRTCLRNMGVKDMDDFCSSCNSENWCAIMFYIYHKYNS